GDLAGALAREDLVERALQRGEAEELLHAVGLDDDVFPGHEGDRDTERVLDTRGGAVHATDDRIQMQLASHGCSSDIYKDAHTACGALSPPMSSDTLSVCPPASHSLDSDPTCARGGRTSQQRRAR